MRDRGRQEEPLQMWVRLWGCIGSSPPAVPSTEHLEEEQTQRPPKVSEKF